MGGPCPELAGERRRPSLQTWSQAGPKTELGPPPPKATQQRPTLPALQQTTLQQTPGLAEKKKGQGSSLIEQLDSKLLGCEQRLGDRVDRQMHVLEALLVQHSQQIEASLVHTLERHLEPSRSAFKLYCSQGSTQPSTTESDRQADDPLPPSSYEDTNPLDTQKSTAAPPEPVAEINSRPRPRLGSNCNKSAPVHNGGACTPNQPQSEVEEVEEVEDDTSGMVDWEQTCEQGHRSSFNTVRHSIMSADMTGNDWLMGKMSDLSQFAHENPEGSARIRLRQVRSKYNNRSKDTRCSMLENIVESACFNCIWDLLIVANALTIGFNAHLSIKSAFSGESVPKWVERVELFFSLLFVTEMVIRVAVLRLGFFLGPNWRWNVFDFAVVVTSAMQDITNSMDDWSRLFRSFRAVRLLRAVRGQRLVTSLRLMIGCMLHSMDTLMWAIVLLVLILYFFTVIFLQGASSWLSIDPDSSSPHAAEVKLELVNYFGSFPKAMLSLFMAVTGGTDWHIMQQCMMTVGPGYGICFLFYVFFMIFGLFNILVGVFVDTAFQSSNMDQDIVIKAEQDQMNAFMKEVKEMFAEIDRDEIGEVSLDQFLGCQRDKRMMSFMQANRLNLINPKRFFHMLDRDESGYVDLQELIMGLMRLGGQARSADVMMLASDTKVLRQELTALATRTDNSLWLMSQFLGLTPEYNSPKDCLD